MTPKLVSGDEHDHHKFSHKKDLQAKAITRYNVINLRSDIQFDNTHNTKESN